MLKNRGISLPKNIMKYGFIGTILYKEEDIFPYGVQPEQWQVSLKLAYKECLWFESYELTHLGSLSKKQGETRCNCPLDVVMRRGCKVHI